MPPVALVTGGGTGLGREISLALAQRGWSVAIGYAASGAEAGETAAALRDLGADVALFQADLLHALAADALVEQTLARFNGLDLLVNNAGTTRYIPLGDLASVTEDDWSRMLGLNAQAPFRLARAAAPALRASRGAIVNVASNSAFVPDGSSLPYIVSKAMLVMLTKCLAVGLAPDVRVNAVAPGWMPTRWLERVLPEDVRERILDSPRFPPIPPADAAAAVVLLAENPSMTGQTIVVDGGEWMH